MSECSTVFSCGWIQFAFTTKKQREKWFVRLNLDLFPKCSFRRTQAATRICSSMDSKINQVLRQHTASQWRELQSGFEFNNLMELQFAILMYSRVKIPYICIRINYYLNWSGFVAASCGERVHDVKAATNLYRFSARKPHPKENIIQVIELHALWLLAGILLSLARPSATNTAII